MFVRIGTIAAVIAAVAVPATLGAGASHVQDSWVVERGGYRLCTPRAVFPASVSFITVCARVVQGHWRPIWSAQAVLTDAYSTVRRPAPVGEVDFHHLQVELKHWRAREGAILISGYIQYADTAAHPAFRAYFGCKRCYGGRSRWWTSDGGAHWYEGPFGDRSNCPESRVGWSLRPAWPAYRAFTCRG